MKLGIAHGGVKSRKSSRDAQKTPDISQSSALSKRRSRKIFAAGFGGHQKFLIGDVRWGRLVRGKCQLEVVNDAIDYGEIGEESNDPHRAAALRADHRINFIDFTDHLGPAVGRDRPELLLHHPERESLKARLLDLPPMGIGVEAAISHRDLALVRYMGSDPGNEFQIVHPLHLSGLSPVPIAHLGSLFIEGESLQGQKRPDHILSYPLSLSLCLGPDPAVDIEPCVAPGENPFCPFGTEELLVDQKPKNLPSEELSQSRVVDPGDLMEEARLVHSALGHQEMEMRVAIDPGSEGLDGGNHSGHQLALGCHLEITGQ